MDIFCMDPSWCSRKAGLWKLDFAVIYVTANLEQFHVCQWGSY